MTKGERLIYGYNDKENMIPCVYTGEYRITAEGDVLITAEILPEGSGKIIADITLFRPMKVYTTYEQAADRMQTGCDTRTEVEWMKYYNQYVDKEEYVDFEDWLADMVSSENLVEEK